MKGRARFAWAASAALALALAAIVIATRFRVGGDVTAFVPDDAGDERLAISKALASSGLGKGMIVLVDGPADEVADATRELSDRLATHPDFEWVQTGVANESQSAVREIFYPARFGFLRDDSDELAALLSDAGLAANAKRLKEILVGPLGASIRATIGSDPLLAFHAIAERASEARPTSIAIESGAFVTTGDAKRGVVFLQTIAAPFDAASQKRTLRVIKAEADELTRSRGARFAVEMSGVNVFAVDGEESTRADIKRISIVSLIGTTLLFLVCFGRLRYLVALFLPIAFGIAGGLAATLALFGEAHGMTLAFGATLIGVSVDYVIHFLTHHVLGQETSARRSLAAVWPAILLGGATTVVGFVGMGLTSTVGMQQIAVFGTVGIAYALLATYALLPFVVSARASRPARLDWVRESLESFFALLERRRGIVAAAGLLILIASAIAVPRLTWQDNPRALATSNEALVARDEAIRAAVATADPGRFIVARGKDWESALRVNDAVATALHAAVEAGELAGFRSLHQLLWSAQLQRRNLEAVWSSPHLADRVRAAMAAEGFRPEAFDEFDAALDGPPPAPVSPAAVIDGPLQPIVRGFYVEGDRGEVMILAQLIGVADPAALAARFDSMDGATFFDQLEFLDSSYGGFRRRVLRVVFLGLFAVLLLVLLRYRSWRPTFAAFVPAVTAAAAALALLGLLGEPLNLLHVLGLMLVLSIGVDYGVFVVEASMERRRGEGGDGGKGVGTAILATGVSCATTILGFGLLAMSENPAMRALGSITALGCLLSLVLAPAALAIVRSR